MRILEEDALTIRYSNGHQDRSIMMAKLVEYEEGEYGLDGNILLWITDLDVPEAQVSFWPEIPKNAPLESPVCYRNGQWYVFQQDVLRWKTLDPTLEDLLL